MIPTVACLQSDTYVTQRAGLRGWDLAFRAFAELTVWLVFGFCVYWYETSSGIFKMFAFVSIFLSFVIFPCLLILVYYKISTFDFARASSDSKFYFKLFLGILESVFNLKNIFVKIILMLFNLSIVCQLTSYSDEYENVVEIIEGLLVTCAASCISTLVSFEFGSMEDFSKLSFTTRDVLLFLTYLPTILLAFYVRYTKNYRCRLPETRGTGTGTGTGTGGLAVVSETPAVSVSTLDLPSIATYLPLIFRAFCVRSTLNDRGRHLAETGVGVADDRTEDDRASQTGNGSRTVPETHGTRIETDDGEDGVDGVAETSETEIMAQ